MDVITQIGNDFSAASSSIYHYLPLVLKLIGLAWLIQLINYLLGYRLNYFGIYPRHLRGLIGIPCAPFLHGNFDHLFFNTVPFFALSLLMLMAGSSIFLCASLLIILISGALTWLLGRSAIHIGASSLVIGYWSYLLIAAYHQKSLITVGLALICIYYFGSFLLSLIPSNEKVSWEGHLFGFLAGLAANYLTIPLLIFIKHSIK